MTGGDRVSSTDDNGNFAFRGVPSGNYTIVIDKEKEFEPFSQAVDIIQLLGSPPQTYSLNIRLTPKANVQPKPGVIDAAIANLPQRARDLFSKAQDLAKAGDHKGAVDQLVFLTAEFPNFMLGFNELGVEYMRLNDLAKADDALQPALKIESEASPSMMNRGMVLLSL